MENILKSSLSDLLSLSGSINSELKRRGMIRTNNLVGDLGESLFKLSFDWKLENNSNCGYDAISPKGEKIQIKTRRSDGPTIQLGAIRNLDQHEFDYLAILIFNNDFEIQYAGIIPYQYVNSFCRHQNYTNSELPIINLDQLKKSELAQDVTGILRRKLSSL